MSFGQVLYQKPAKSSSSCSAEFNFESALAFIVTSFKLVFCGGTDEDDIETLDKPINSDQDGEILVQPADTLGSCIDEGGKLVPGTRNPIELSDGASASRLARSLPRLAEVWVLQGSAVDFQHEGSTLAVPRHVAQ